MSPTPFEKLADSTRQLNATNYDISLCCRYIQNNRFASPIRIAVMAIMVFSIPLFLSDILLVQRVYSQNTSIETIDSAPTNISNIDSASVGPDQPATTNNTNSSIMSDFCLINVCAIDNARTGP